MKQIKKLMKRAVVLMTMAAVLLGSGIFADAYTGNQVVAEAAVKTESFDLAISETLDLDSEMVWTGTAVIGEKSPTYSYSSSKTSVASVSKKGVVTAKAAGTAKITIKQTKNGKTTTFGTAKITVHKSKISVNTDYCFTVAEGLYETYPRQFEAWDYISYVNPNATYTWFSGNTKVLAVTKKGKVTHVEGKGDTKVKMTVKETYKGKTRKVGTFSVLVSEPRLKRESGSVIEMKKGEQYDFYQDLSEGAYCLWNNMEMTSDELYATEQEAVDALQKLFAEDEADGDEDEPDSVLRFETGSEGHSVLKAYGAGTKYVYFYTWNWTTRAYDNYLGYVKIVVTE